MSSRKVTLALRKLTLREAKRACIIEGWQRHERHAEEAAEELGIGNSTMYRLINELRITEKERAVRVVPGWVSHRPPTSPCSH